MVFVTFNKFKSGVLSTLINVIVFPSCTCGDKTDAKVLACVWTEDEPNLIALNLNTAGHYLLRL